MLFVRRTVLLGKGVGAAFTAVAPKCVGTTLVLWLEFEAGQRGLLYIASTRGKKAKQSQIINQNGADSIYIYTPRAPWWHRTPCHTATSTKQRSWAARCAHTSSRFNSPIDGNKIVHHASTMACWTVREPQVQRERVQGVAPLHHIRVAVLWQRVPLESTATMDTALLVAPRASAAPLSNSASAAPAKTRSGGGCCGNVGTAACAVSGSVSRMMLSLHAEQQAPHSAHVEAKTSVVC